jgi:hypothetical protein
MNATVAERAEEIRQDLQKRGITPRCRLCRMELRAPRSIIRGVGPTCWLRERAQLRLFEETK